MSSRDMFFPRAILILSILALPVIIRAQGTASIGASVNKNKIMLGEPMLLTVEVRIPTGTPITFERIDSIPHFEIQGEPDIDTSVAGDVIMIRGTYTLTSFDSGHWIIPAFSLSRGIQSDTIPVDVVFSEFDPQQEYHDIKDIIEIKPKKKKQWWWYAIGGALLLAMLITYLVKRKKPVVIPKKTIAVDAYEEAMKQLDALQRNKPDTRQYYTQLVNIFRLYISKRKNIHSLQKTTDDLIIQLRELGLDKEQYSRLAQSLRMADFVKFAKYVPGSDDDAGNFKEIRNAVITIEEKSKPVLAEKTS